MNRGNTSYIIKLDQSCQFKKLGVEWGGEKDFETNWFPKLCSFEAQNLENKRAIIYSQRTTKDLYGEINI